MVQLRLLYSSAFRAPSRVELDTINNPSTIGNPNLNAENIDSYEAVLVHQFEKQTIALSIFRNEFSDIIVSVPSSTVGQSTYANSGTGTFEGIELEYNALFFNSLNTRFGYTNIFNKPSSSFATPEQTFSGVLNYNYSNINFNLSGYFHDSVQNDFGTYKEKLDSYTIVNTKISYAFIKGAKVYVHIKNLLDETYYTPTEGSTLTVNLPNRGFEGFIGLEYSF